MGRQTRVVVLSAAFGGAMWVVDAVADTLFFYEGTFFSLLLWDVPPHELYVRTTILVSFLAFGLVASRLVAGLDEREQSLQLFRTLVDRARDMVFVMDPDTGRFLDVNEAVCDQLGYDRSELLDMYVSDVSTVAETPSEFRAFIRSPSGEQFVNREAEHERSDGSTIPVEVSASTVEVGGDRYRIAVAREISDRKERERQLRVMDRILRHNLNNDMTTILGHAEVIKEDPDADHAALADRIIETGEDLVETTDKERQIVNLLTESRTTVTLDLPGVCERVADQVGDAYPDAEVRTDCPDELSVRVVAEFPTALHELVENGIEHSTADRPTVRVAAEQTDGAVRITVVDDGPGIPETERKVLVGDEEIQPLYHGSGLGLWLVSHIVNQSGGELHFEEGDAGNSVVVLTVPASPEDHLRTELDPTSAERSPKPDGGRTSERG